MTQDASTKLEEWMHASDEERNAMHAQWDLAANEGHGIVSEVANLFKDECIYNITGIGISKNNTHWVIDAYVSDDDFENLKNRYNIEFLGFKINFHNQT